MANLTKGLNITFATMFLSIFSYCQVLSDASLSTLTNGGVVYDVEYDPYHEVYFVVGNFNEYDSTPVNNLVVINADDFSINFSPNLNPVQSIDGEIRSVELARIFDPFSSNLIYHLYLGGNFETVESSNGSFTRKGIVDLTSYHNVTQPATSSTNFVVSSWDAQLDMTGFGDEGVNDIEIENDTVYYVGDFFFSGASPTGNSDNGRFDLANYNFLSDTDFGFYGATVTLYEVDEINGEIYVGGFNFPNEPIFHRINENGTIDAGFQYNIGASDGIYEIAQIDDSLICVNFDAGASTQGSQLFIHRSSDGSEKIDHELTPESDGSIGGMGFGKFGLTSYKNYVFTSTSQSGTGLISFEIISGTGPVPAPNWSGQTNDLNTNKYGNFLVEQNSLFVSTDNLTTADGQAVSGLAIYCLEPHDPDFFIQSDSTVCPGQIITYEIPAVEFADGYLWQYTGDGADINNTGAPSNLTFYGDNPSYNSVDVKYTDLFTSGQLTVTPYSYCNGTDLLFSKTVYTNIVSNPLPDANAGLDTMFNCAIDTILLVGTSTTSSVTFEWIPPAPQTNVNSDSIYAYVDNEFVFKVTDSLGCYSKDTLFIGQDTIKPDVILPPGPYDLTCSDSIKTFTGSSTNADTISYWINLSNSTTQPNPITVNSPGTYRYIVQDTTNFCSDSAEILIYLNQPQPNITVQGYPPLNSSVPLDTLTCYEPAFNLVCDSDTSNVTATWCNQDSTNQIGPNITIDSAGNYYILVTNNDNGCQNFTGINIAEFTNPPDVILPMVGDLNCSTDSLLANGSSTITDVNLIWTGDSISSSANPIYIEDPGNYYLTVTRNDNGCSSMDSILVGFYPEIVVSLGDDTIACDQSLITVNAEISGTISGQSQLWNNGETAVSTFYFAGSDSIVTIEVFGDNGCFGTDTLIIEIPPVPVIEFETFKSCDDGGFGQIIANPISGFGPFTYSKDNGVTYQSSSVLDSLSVGSHDIWVKDSLGCDYQYQATISENSSLPEANFLFSTYNFQGDTIALLDVSNPPSDSIDWTIPAGINIVMLEPFPLITIPDTGQFEITMIAYFGNCLVSKSKNIYSSLFDSTSANYYNQNGIESVELYPNPNSGYFTAEVVFYKSQRSRIFVQDEFGNIYFDQVYGEMDQITQAIDITSAAVSGTYFLIVISEFDGESIPFVIAQ